MGLMSLLPSSGSMSSLTSPSSDSWPKSSSPLSSSVSSLSWFDATAIGVVAGIINVLIKELGKNFTNVYKIKNRIVYHNCCWNQLPCHLAK